MAVAPRPGQDAGKSSLRGARGVGDPIFYGLNLFFAIVVIVAAFALVATIVLQAWPAIGTVGTTIFTSTNWDTGSHVFGALTFITGTIITSVIALLLAGVVGIMIAVFLVELAPPALAKPVSFLIEMLAAVPSIIFGLWGIFVLIPFILPFETFLHDHLGFTVPFTNISLFGGNFVVGNSIFTASIILAVMILPTVSALSRDVMAAVPGSQREGMMALGATRWEVVSRVVIPYARAGIVGALILALGRAVGETMAVTMVIGNAQSPSPSLLTSGNSLASALANNLGEAFSDPVWLGALFELALLLLGISLLLNIVARLLVRQVNKGAAASARK